MDPIDTLTSGFRAFRDGCFQDKRATYEQLVDRGQRPKVALIACSDSRVDPALLLQADPGELFIIRNVANLIPPFETEGAYHGTSAALEFAVEHLKVGHIIVMGHSHCGGIKALFDRPAEGEGHQGFIAPWMSLVESAYRRVEGTMPEASLAEKARVCEQSAVLVSLENLMTFPAIREGVKARRLRLHGWFVDIRDCDLQIFDPADQAFKSVT